MTPEEAPYANRFTPPDAAERVAALPRRVAHATHALIEATHDHRGGPMLASEACIFDVDAPSVAATGSALQRARARGLVVLAGRYWYPTLDALDLERALEDRFLAETAEDGRDV